jgi:selenocysteine-specific elongation factor
MYVLGTAGHVDHGKSTLVRAITGIDPDRLQEEKAREMTIDLGFAWLTLPSGKEVSIVDVPGHERFIKNMLAGAGGIDAALLVIAADEGPMPQTEEHLDILHLLGVDRGIVVLTKTDMVDEDWLELVQEEIRDRLKNTTLHNAPIVPVSARTGRNLPGLLAAIDRLLDGTEQRADRGAPRLPIDRAFTIAGFGTVVTGTLIDGSLHVGQEVEIVPGGLKSRIRGIQSHKHKTESIEPGNRVAVNLVGLDVDQIRRGMVLALPGKLRPSNRVDVHLHLLPDAPSPLEQNDPLDFFTGAAESPAQITLLDTDRLQPGDTAWAQIRLRDEVSLLKGDRYIVRQPSPSLTVGGGQVIDAHPRRHKRFNAETLSALETLQKGTPEELIMQALGMTALDARAVVDKSALEKTDAERAIQALLDDKKLLLLAGDAQTIMRNPQSAILMAEDAFQDAIRRVHNLLAIYHKQQPLRRGMSKEELRSRMSSIISARAFPHVMARAVERGAIAEGATIYRTPEHEPRYSPAQEAQVSALRSAYAKTPYSPPSPTELAVEPDVLAALVESGELVKIDENIYYTRATLDEMRERIVHTIDEQGDINVALMRDVFGTTRKYAIPLLEYFDNQKITRRVGDARVRW